MVAAVVVVAAAALAAAAFLPSEGRPPGVAVPTATPSPLIPLDEVFSGGPGKDGIPPIDEPRFEPVDEVEWLTPREPVIALEIDGEVRAYPLQILVWHEIVNDELGGVPVSVTFCPLCNTAYVFERPVVNGSPTTFGTSGNLYLSNLVMYDRATESWWPQVMGKAAVGLLTGTELVRRPAQIVAWQEFRDAFPDAVVLSRDTGFDRDYGTNPYPGYDDVGTPPYAYFGIDGTLDATERILGVETRDGVLVFPYSELSRAARGGVAAVDVERGAERLAVFWDKGTTSALDAKTFGASRAVGAAAAFIPRAGGRHLTFAVEDGAITDRQTHSRWNLFGRATEGPLQGTQLPRADGHDSYWFDWAAFHPDSKIWKGGTRFASVP